MESQFATYEIALKLKELGFDEPCLAIFEGKDISQSHWDHSISQARISRIYGTKAAKAILAPLWQQCIDWFREKHHYHIDVTFREVKGKKVEGINSVYFDIEIYHLFGGDAWKTYSFNQISDDFYYTREQAILRAIELIEIKTKQL